jgi:hypothetical protein
MTPELLQRSTRRVTCWWRASRWLAYIDAGLFTGALWPSTPPGVAGWLITCGLLVLCAIATWGVFVVRCPSCDRSLLPLAARQGGVRLCEWLGLLSSCPVCADNREGQESLGGTRHGGGVLTRRPSGVSRAADATVTRSGESSAGTLVAAGTGLLIALVSAGLITFLLIQLRWFGEEPEARSSWAAGLAVGAWVPGAILGTFAATRLAPCRSRRAALLVAGMLLMMVGLLVVAQTMAERWWECVLWAAAVVVAAGVGYGIGRSGGGQEEDRA